MLKFCTPNCDGPEDPTGGNPQGPAIGVWQWILKWQTVSLGCDIRVRNHDDYLHNWNLWVHHLFFFFFAYRQLPFCNSVISIRHILLQLPIPAPYPAKPCKLKFYTRSGVADLYFKKQGLSFPGRLLDFVFYIPLYEDTHLDDNLLDRKTRGPQPSTSFVCTIKAKKILARAIMIIPYVRGAIRCYYLWLMKECTAKSSILKNWW